MTPTDTHQQVLRSSLPSGGGCASDRPAHLVLHDRHEAVRSLGDKLDDVLVVAERYGVYVEAFQPVRFLPWHRSDRPSTNIRSSPLSNHILYATIPLNIVSFRFVVHRSFRTISIIYHVSYRTSSSSRVMIYHIIPSR